MFELIPCTFAGMSEGCKWHRNRLRTKKWVTHPFELIEETSEKPPPKSTEGVEFVPTHDGQEWSLQPCPVRTKEQQKIAAEAIALKAAMIYGVQRFLDGLDSDEDINESVYQ